MVVDAWTTVMSSDNECGHYCRQPDGHYYTIAVTNRSDNSIRILVPEELHLVEPPNFSAADNSDNCLELI